MLLFSWPMFRTLNRSHLTGRSLLRLEILEDRLVPAVMGTDMTAVAVPTDPPPAVSTPATTPATTLVSDVSLANSRVLAGAEDVVAEPLVDAGPGLASAGDAVLLPVAPPVPVIGEFTPLQSTSAQVQQPGFRTTPYGGGGGIDPFTGAGLEGTGYNPLRTVGNEVRPNDILGDWMRMFDDRGTLPQRDPAVTSPNLKPPMEEAPPEDDQSLDEFFRERTSVSAEEALPEEGVLDRVFENTAEGLSLQHSTATVVAEEAGMPLWTAGIMLPLLAKPVRSSYRRW